MAKISSPVQHLLPVIKLDLSNSQYLDDISKEVQPTEVEGDAKIAQGERAIVTWRNSDGVLKKKEI